MKIHNVVIIFCGLLLTGMLCLLYTSKVRNDYGHQNRVYADYLSAACVAAMHGTDKDITFTSDGVWTSENARKSTLRHFYDALAECLNKDDFELESIAEHVPVILLVDNDGFYISYNACFDEYGNAIVPEDSSHISTIGGLNTYVGVYDGITVRYFLSDFVEVTLADGTMYEPDDRRVVYEQLPGYVQGSLAFFLDDKEYAEIRANVIAGTVEDVINYYLNTQIPSRFNTGNQVTIPRSPGEFWCRSIEHPTIISYYQGEEEWLDGDVLSAWAYAGGEINECHKFFVCDGLYYRWNDQITVETQVVDGINYFFFEGKPVEGIFSSMEDCVRAGASPAPKIYE